MKTILTIIGMMMALNSFAQQAFETATDEKNGSIVYKGQITFSDLQAEKTFTWMRAADNYKPDAGATDFLGANLPRYRIIVFMGTWCDDSHILVPQLYKLLSLTRYPMGELTMYGVDRTKTTKDGTHERYKIDKVPTIILLRNGKEAGRITETARKSIEEDMVKIIEKDK